jgi:hypothetical protein
MISLLAVKDLWARPRSQAGHSLKDTDEPLRPVVFALGMVTLDPMGNPGGGAVQLLMIERGRLLPVPADYELLDEPDDGPSFGASVASALVGGMIARAMGDSVMRVNHDARDVSDVRDATAETEPAPTEPQNETPE